VSKQKTAKKKEKGGVKIENKQWVFKNKKSWLAQFFEKKTNM